jgi:hypothetical protein
MLVKNTRLGAALASHFTDNPKSKGPDSETQLDHSVVLMRGHGLTVAAPAIEHCVLRAIYTQQNAAVQSTALTIRTAARLGGCRTGESVDGVDMIKPMRYLSESETVGCKDMTERTAMRPWNLWVREVEAAGLYVNMA